MQNAMIHSVDEPLGGCSMELPFNLKGEHSGNLKRAKSSIQCYLPIETHACQMDTTFGEEEWHFNNSFGGKKAWNGSILFSPFSMWYWSILLNTLHSWYG